MPNYHRYFIPGSMVFITCVTQHRIPYLSKAQDIDLFWETLRNVQKIHPFHLLAYAILPDHFHWIMQMPENDPVFSVILHSIKRNFTWNFKKAYQIPTPFHVWQDRYWDHVIRDEPDLTNHFDYIHWNPVKHGLVDSPEKWTYSSFNHWLGKGEYARNWGSVEPRNIRGMEVE